MGPQGRHRTGIAVALMIGMMASSPAAAAGWELREFETPLGDRGVGLVVRAKRQADVHLGIGCDGDTGSRWRGVAVIEEADSAVGLGMRGDVRIRVGDTATRDLWAVRISSTGRRVFTAPESTRLARRLLREEAATPTAEVAIEIHGIAGKPVTLTFPLAGLGAKIDALIKRCDDWDLKLTE